MHVPPTDTNAAPTAPMATAITEPAPASPLLRNTALIGAAALGSRVLGFVRDMGMAWLLGSSLAADALVLGLRLPHVLRRLLGEGALSMTLTADLSRAAAGTASPAPHPAYIRALCLRLACILGLAVLLGELLAEPLLLLLAPGQQHHAALTAEATPLLRLCLPYAFTATLAALGMALLNSQQRFLLPALMPALFNAVVLTFTAFAAWKAPTPSDAALLLACGVLCGGAAQALLPWWALRCGVPATEAHVETNTMESRRQASLAAAALRRLPLGVLGAAAPQLAILGAMITASWLPQGSVSALYYAERLLELPMGVAGAALGIASLPALARLAAAGEEQEFSRLTGQALRLSLLSTLPAMAGLMAVAWPLVEVLFARGAFEHEAVRATVLALLGYAPGLPAYGLTRPLLAACHARQRSRLSAVSGLVAVAVALVASAALTFVLPAPYALLGAPLGVSLGLWAQSLLLFQRLNSRAHPLRLHWGSLAQQSVAALCTGFVAFGITCLARSVWLQLPLAVLAGIACYAFCLWCARNEDFLTLLARRT